MLSFLILSFQFLWCGSVNEATHNSKIKIELKDFHPCSVDMILESLVLCLSILGTLTSKSWGITWQLQFLICAWAPHWKTFPNPVFERRLLTFSRSVSFVRCKSHHSEQQNEQMLCLPVQSCGNIFQTIIPGRKNIVLMQNIFTSLFTLTLSKFLSPNEFFLWESYLIRFIYQSLWCDYPTSVTELHSPRDLTAQCFSETIRLAHAF